jgi:site-specific recombinase XerD
MDVAEAIRKGGERRRFSPRTIETYQECLEIFFRQNPKPVNEITKKDVREFLENLIENDRAGGTIHVYLNAIKFYFEEILGRNFRLDIKYCKRPTVLPEVLTKEETTQVIGVIKNSKHKLMISLLYGAGLRVSELLNLKVKEINFENKYGFIRHGKGNKDRIFILPDSILLQLRELIKFGNLSVEDFMFLTNRRERYSPRSIAEIIKQSCQIVGIKRRIHPHTMRHSFATHLIQNGNSVNEVQSLLGHKSPETTMIYVHLASPKMLNIKSPLDSLDYAKEKSSSKEGSSY